MKLLIIRHGEPDYVKDSLTEKGFREAGLLAEYLSGLDLKEIYVSPLGRAKDTAEPTLLRMGRTAKECGWLREFWPQILRPDNKERRNIVWDWLPEDWTADGRYFDKDEWCRTEVMREAGVEEAHRFVTEGFDALLAEHGYVREKGFYRVERPNRDKLAFFCHFGLQCILLAHLFNISPMPLWHGLCAAPTAVTSVCTEERRKGKASFRVNCFGDVSHLLRAGEEPSFSARFCETFDGGERHD